MLEELKNESSPDKRTQLFLNDLNSSDSPPMEQLQPEEAREILLQLQQNDQVNLPECEIAEKEISFEGQKLLLHIIRPAGAKERIPAFMFFHGGGWVLGDFQTHERLVRDLVTQSGMACVFVEYTRSPEAIFPTALNQAYFATKWVADNSEEINVDGGHLAVAGNSVGGNLATAVAMMAKIKQGPKISFQLLMWPVTNADFITESYDNFHEGYFLTRNMMKWFWAHYIQDEEKRNDILASPLKASTDQLRDLPPALIQIAECDVLRDEGEAYARKLDSAGVDVTVTRYIGMIHDFGLLNPLADLPEVKSAILQAGQELRNHLIVH